MATSHRKKNPQNPHIYPHSSPQSSGGSLICKVDKNWIDQNWDEWAPNPGGGIFLRRGQLFTLNGTKEKFRDYYDGWGPHYNDDLMIRVGNYFFSSRNQRVFYRGPWDDYRPHPDGVAIRLGNRFLVNGQNKNELPHHEPWDEWDIQPFTGEVCTRFGLEYYIGEILKCVGLFGGWDIGRHRLVFRDKNRFLLDNNTNLFIGQYHGWRAYLDGVAIRWYNEWRYYTG